MTSANGPRDSKELSVPRDSNDTSSDESLTNSQPPEAPHTLENDTPYDLEKTTTGASNRVTRIQSLTRRRPYEDTFTHPLSHTPTSRDVIVDFNGAQDPYYPLNWPLRKKIATTALYGFTTMGATFASSVYSPAVPSVASEFSVSTTVSLLGLSLLLVGFGLGPLLFGPISEMYGRKPAVLTPYFVGAMFCFGTGAAKDTQTVLITRLFTGLFASAPVTNTGGVLSDIWHPTERGTAIAFYAFAVVAGPTMGPIIGGAFITAGVTWRWVQYLTGILMMVVWVLDVLILDETYAPVLLVYKARRLRVKTGNWALHARHEEWDPSIKDMVMKFGVRPFQMLLTPICFSMALYASFCYGLLYANFAAFPIVFQEERGWNPLVGSLPFLSLLVGNVLGGLANMLNQRYYNHRYVSNDHKAVPEARLPPMMVGSVFFAAGLFIFGWTAPVDIHWAGPVMGTFLTGFGFVTIFQSALNYLIDTFQRYSASAVAANTFLRSALACAFPLFISPMFHKLGIPWGVSIFAFVSVAMIPIPYLFWIYNPTIRKKGKYSANMG